MDRRLARRRGRPRTRRASPATRSWSTSRTTRQPTAAQIVIPVAERLGANVIEFDNLSKGFGDRLLIDDLSFKLPPGGIVGVIGPNGAGKTTLFRMITGQEKPDSGAIKIGETVELGYVDQSRDALDANKTVWEEISGGADVLYLGKREINSRAYCGAFNFKGSDQQKKVGMLSGGERNRVHLAKMLKSGANLLLLDEPTNDLDVDTLARARRGAAGFRRLRGHHQPRPLLPRPHRHPHARLRGRQPCRVVRGQFRRLRGGQEAAARHRQRHPAPAEVQEVLALSGAGPSAPVMTGNKPSHAAAWRPRGSVPAILCRPAALCRYGANR